MDRILPFLSLPSALLQERSNQLQNDAEFWMANNAFTIQIRNAGRRIIAKGPMKEVNARPEQMILLLEGIAKWLPDLNLTITGHDSPWVMIAGEARARHVEAAKAGRGKFPFSYGITGLIRELVLSAEQLAESMDNWDLNGFSVVCPPDSEIRKAGDFDQRKQDWVKPETSFIEDHLTSMDLCTHPERQAIHGFTAWFVPLP